MGDFFDTHLQMPWGKTITFPEGRELSHGMRLSTHCPVQRVAEYFDEEIGPPFDPGVAAIGHLYSYLWCHQTDTNMDVRPDNEILEMAVPWEHGNAHIDRVILSGLHAGVYEIKTTSSKDPKPSAENRAQVARYAAASLISGDGSIAVKLAGLPRYIAMIGKAGNESGWVRGPFECDLDDPSPVKYPGMHDGATAVHYAAWDIMATASMKQVIHDNADTMDIASIISRPDLVAAYCSCGQHVLPPVVTVDDPILASAMTRYRSGLEAEKAEKAAKVEAYATVKDMAKKLGEGRWEIAGHVATVNRDGRVSVR